MWWAALFRLSRTTTAPEDTPATGFRGANTEPPTSGKPAVIEAPGQLPMPGFLSGAGPTDVTAPTADPFNFADVVGVQNEAHVFIVAHSAYLCHQHSRSVRSHRTLVESFG